MSDEQIVTEQKSGGGSLGVSILGGLVDVDGGGNGASDFRQELRSKFASDNDYQLSDDEAMSMYVAVANKDRITAWKDCIARASAAAEAGATSRSVWCSEQPGTSDATIVLLVKTKGGVPFRVSSFFISGAKLDSAELRIGESYPSDAPLVLKPRLGEDMVVMVVTDKGTAKFIRAATPVIDEKPITPLKPRYEVVAIRKDGTLAEGTRGDGVATRSEIPKGTTLTEIKVFWSPWVMGLELAASDGSIAKFGHSLGSPSQITLQDGEVIKSVSGVKGFEISTIKITTNKRTLGPFGARPDELAKRGKKERLEEYWLNVPTNSRLVGFYGRKANVVNSIGLVLEHDEKREVNAE